MARGKRRKATQFRMRRVPAILLASVLAMPLFTSASGQGFSAADPRSPTEAPVEVSGDRFDELATAMASRAEVQATLLARTDPAPVLVDTLPREAKVEVSSPKGTRVWTASALADHNLPLAAKRAYVRAAARSERTDPGCNIPWTLLAAIGRVESDHGRYGGSELGTDGVSRPHILGLPLNGVGPVAAIHDTDGGRLDGDTDWDRAVGPMQFIPSTWAMSGTDGDGDGTVSPHDLDDAAAAAASYLCAGGGDLRDPAAQKVAIYRYNHSDYYVSLVRAFEAGYRTGEFSVPAPPEVQQAAAKQKSDQPKAKKDGKRRSQKAARADQKRSTKATAAASKSPSASTSPSKQPGKSPSATPGKTPGQAPGKTPGKSPSGSPGTGSPSPSKPGTSTPAVPAQRTAVFTECGAVDYCLGGTMLDLGTVAQYDAVAAGDFDGDLDVETNAEELAGMVDRSVTMVVVPVAGGKLGIISINGVPLA